MAILSAPRLPSSPVLQFGRLADLESHRFDPFGRVREGNVISAGKRAQMHKALFFLDHGGKSPGDGQCTRFVSFQRDLLRQHGITSD